MPDINRTILITGVSSGIGFATAQLLLNQGYRVIGVSRQQPVFKDNEKFSHIILDLQQPETAAQQFASLKAQWADVDDVLFCAGFGRFASLEEFSIEQIQSLIAVNFTSHALLSRLILPTLKRTGDANMIFIGSEAALQGSRKGTVYCAAKFAVRGFAQALRDECSRSGVRVTCINPGMVKSEFFEALDFEPGDQPGQFIDVSDVADAVLFVLRSSHHIVLDELNLSPLNKVINFKKR